jgi:endonuclease/exonuclease/phosphatase (EEP) superfamily protein YafD
LFATIFSQNLHRHRESTFDFYRQLQLDPTAAVACLQEPGLVRNISCIPPANGWDMWTFTDNDQVRSGAAIVWNKALVRAKPVAFPHPDVAIIDCVFIQSNYRCTIASVYRSRQYDFDTLPVLQLLDGKRNVIIAGDFNAHHVSWGSKEDDRNGRDIVECFVQFGYTLANDISLGPTFGNYKTGTYIDLTWTKNLPVAGWMLADNVVSDHRTLKWHIPVPVPGEPEPKF